MNRLLSTPRCAALALALFPPALDAAMLGLPASDSGFYNAAGRSSKNDGVVMGASPATFNYSAGAIDEAPPLLGPPFGGMDVPRKNYFTFDLTGISADILGASLELYLPDEGYGSPDPTETYSVYGSFLPGVPEMTGFAGALADVHSIFSPPSLMMAMDHYGKLADTKGVLPAFASVTLDASAEDSMVSMTFTPTGLAYLNLFKGGFLVLAGTIDTLDGVPGMDEFVFGYSAPLIPGVVTPDPDILAVTPTPVLFMVTSDVPEPRTWVAGLVMLTAVGWTRVRLGAPRSTRPAS